MSLLIVSDFLKKRWGACEECQTINVNAAEGGGQRGRRKGRETLQIKAKRKERDGLHVADEKANVACIKKTQLRKACPKQCKAKQVLFATKHTTVKTGSPLWHEVKIPGRSIDAEAKFKQREHAIHSDVQIRSARRIERPDYTGNRSHGFAQHRRANGAPTKTQTFILEMMQPTIDVLAQRNSSRSDHATKAPISTRS